MAGPAKWIAKVFAQVFAPFQRDGAGWFGVMLLIVAVPLVLLAAYKQWGDVIVGNKIYMVQADELKVSPSQPTWIYGNVKAEVFRDGGLPEMSTLNPDLTRRMIDAFEVHPWVASVDSLRKQHPNRVFVRLSYRRPVAMVEVFDGERGWISPIDKTGHVLPTDGFTNKLDKPENYVRIHAGEVTPGVAGTLWTDVRVRDAAAVANVLHDKHKELGIYRVVAMPASEEFRTPQFALATRNRTAILWGSAPSQEEPHEARAQDKLLRLVNHVSENGPLDQIPENQLLDLRREHGATITPRTARRP